MLDAFMKQKDIHLSIEYMDFIRQGCVVYVLRFVNVCFHLSEGISTSRATTQTNFCGSEKYALDF